MRGNQRCDQVRSEVIRGAQVLLILVLHLMDHRLVVRALLLEQSAEFGLGSDLHAFGGDV